MNCKVCRGSTENIFTTLVLTKYDVQYYQCTNCEFIQTEDPYWLNEAYESAITKLDIGLVSRNIHFSDIVKGFFDKGIFDDRGVFLDYAGGYGLFVRMMRDLGLNFFRQDSYCENIFAKHFDIEDLPKDKIFDVLTAFEVFEHLVDPREELQKMLKLSDTVIFSTLLQPGNNLTPDSWWYFTPQTGQHIALYSKDSLRFLAKEFDLNFYSNGVNLHIFSKKELPIDPFILPRKSIFQKVYYALKNKLAPQTKVGGRESLTLHDYEYVKGLK